MTYQRLSSLNTNRDATQVRPKFWTVFEAVHGSAPDIAGKGIANPTALLQSAILMLRHIEERSAADKIETAMLRVFAEGKVRTRDVGGMASTGEFAEAIMRAIKTSDSSRNFS